MQICSYCKSQETELYENGAPICLSCANSRDAKSPTDQVQSESESRETPAGDLTQGAD
jgi:hypothetical protein